MSSSFLTHNIRRTSDLLRLGASDQVTEYENRFQTLRTLHDRLLSDLILSDSNHGQASETAKEFFGSPTIRFAGIDGTLYSRPLFDLIIFFGGAYASTGTITLASQQKEAAYYMTRQKENSGKQNQPPIGYKIDNQPTDINDPSIGKQRRKGNRRTPKTNNKIGPSAGANMLEVLPECKKYRGG